MARDRKLFDSSYAKINHTHDVLPPSGHGAVYTPTSRVLTAGAGLTGGGDLSANRTFTVGAGTGITVNADDVALSAASLASLALADTALQPGSFALDDLSDVNAPTPGDGEVLTWDDVAGEWIAAPGGSGSGVVETIIAGIGIVVDDTDPANVEVAVDEAFAFEWTASHNWTDNDEISLGTGLDFRLYHDGTDNIIRNAAGQLNVLFGSTKRFRFLSNGGAGAACAIEFSDSTPTAKAYIGIANAADDVIAGSLPGDLFIRSQAERILVSTDSGASIMATFGADGNTTFNSGATANVMDWNSDAASGLYVTLLRSGTAIADMGNAGQMGGTLDGFGIVTRASQPIEFGTGSSTIRWRMLNSGDFAVLSGNIELGHATDTTLSRSAAGRLAVEGVDVLLEGEAPGALDTLENEILADSPLAYWKLDEASGNFADSSGNGRTLTAGGSPSYQYAAIVPRETTKFVYFDAAGDNGTRADACGLSVPATGDWTFETCVFAHSHLATQHYRFFTIGAAGATEVANYQVLASSVGSSTTGETHSANMHAFWESGVGVGNTITAPLARWVAGVPSHLAWVKNGTANTVSFYVNGTLAEVVAYSTEPTGGSTATTFLHDVPDTGTERFVAMAHAALYDTALSQARIRAHAQAGGYLAQ